MLLDFDELLEAMPPENRAAIRNGVQESLLNLADRQDRKEIEYGPSVVGMDSGQGRCKCAGLTLINT